MKPNENRRTIAFTEDLRSEDALCTLDEAIERPNITGCLGDYLYCVKNGRQILLGHDGGLAPLGPGSTVGVVQYIYVSKDLTHHRHTETWEELRDYMRAGWVIGTIRYPGVKFWFMDNGRNNRRAPERIFVFKASRQSV